MKTIGLIIVEPEQVQQREQVPSEQEQAEKPAKKAKGK